MLFPPTMHEPLSLSLLKNYLCHETTSLTAGGLQANFDVWADGTGNWEFRAIITPTEEFYGTYGVGFVFDFSQDGTGHGYLQIDNEQRINDSEFGIDTVTVTIEGFDLWIHNNWVDLFARPSQFILYNGNDDDQLDAYSTGTKLAQSAGFSDLQMLEGASVTHNVSSRKQPIPPHGEKPGIGINWPPPDDAGDDGGDN